MSALAEFVRKSQAMKTTGIALILICISYGGINSGRTSSSLPNGQPPAQAQQPQQKATKFDWSGLTGAQPISQQPAAKQPDIIPGWEAVVAAHQNGPWQQLDRLASQAESEQGISATALAAAIRAYKPNGGAGISDDLFLLKGFFGGGGDKEFPSWRAVIQRNNFLINNDLARPGQPLPLKQ